MISTKWFQGIDKIDECLKIRQEVFGNELKQFEEGQTDQYDIFAFSVAVYEDSVAAGCGRLIYKDNRYTIDKLCVKEQYRGKSYGELLLRMLVRKAVTIGAEKTYALVPRKYVSIFEQVGFYAEKDELDESVHMIKIGDVGGCCS